MREPDRDEHRRYLKSLHDTVIVRDILERDRRRDRRRITNPDLLKRICEFLADNVGSSNSVNSIAGAINSEGMKVANSTVDAYIGALAPLRIIHDAFPKMVVVGKGDYPTNIDGIRIVNAINFLLGR